MKKLIITMDTEGDNLWAWKPGKEITTENTVFLARFQTLCEKYGFKPTWLTNYEMICDPRYVRLITDVVGRNAGELGMHLHAWNNPPDFSLPIVSGGAPYLVEYPSEIMEAKIAALHQAIIARTGIVPTSHRAGRWAMNQTYFELLQKYGYDADCSVTPGINWASSLGQTAGAIGADYSNSSTTPFFVGNSSVLEVPVTVLKSHKCFADGGFKDFLKNCYHALSGQLLWLRPNGRNLKQMLYVANQVSKSSAPYLMFMLHSSELMPGGSPTFRTEQDIDQLYGDLEFLFAYLAQFYEGITLHDFRKNYQV